MNITIDIFGLISLLIAVSAILISISRWSGRRDREVEQIKSDFERYNSTCEEVLNRAEEMLNNINAASFSQNLRPELTVFVTRQWKFFEKTFHNRFEKHSICRRIVTEYMQDNANILLDSGSTIDLISFEILSSKKTGINVLSNNIFAAMHLVGVREIAFRLLPGIFNDRFAATYSEDANVQVLNHDFNTIIVAATAISFETGIMVHKGDNENLNFKISILKNFEQSSTAKLIIALDATKFIKDTRRHQGVFSENKWAELLNKYPDRIIIVTSPLRTEFTVEERVIFTNQLAKFENARIKVDLCSI